MDYNYHHLYEEDTRFYQGGQGTGGGLSHHPGGGTGGGGPWGGGGHWGGGPWGGPWGKPWWGRPPIYSVPVPIYTQTAPPVIVAPAPQPQVIYTQPVPQQQVIYTQPGQ
ncbi:hypothetical protein ACFC4S_22515 [Priestia megaterium]|uniref:hypothetical protein n=1 Tax=Priestia megaterium TaxID=1404 RepID=UPI0035DBCA77